MSSTRAGTRKRTRTGLFKGKRAALIAGVLLAISLSAAAVALIGDRTGSSDRPSTLAGGGSPTARFPGKFAFTFVACDTRLPARCNRSPLENGFQLHLARFDGSRVSPLRGYKPRIGDLADQVRRGKVLYVYVIGEVRRFDLTGGFARFSPKRVVIRTRGGAIRRTREQSFIVDPKSGRIVVLYPTADGKRILSATEVRGSGGARFREDAGVRFRAEGAAVDPDVFRGPNGYVLYLSAARPGCSVLAVQAKTLRGRYSDIAGLPGSCLIPNEVGVGVPAGYYDRDSRRFWTFVHSDKIRPRVILRAVHPGLSTPLAEPDFATVLTGAQVPGLGRKWELCCPDIVRP